MTAVPRSALFITPPPPVPPLAWTRGVALIMALDAIGLLAAIGFPRLARHHP